MDLNLNIQDILGEIARSKSIDKLVEHVIVPVLKVKLENNLKFLLDSLIETVTRLKKLTLETELTYDDIMFKETIEVFEDALQQTLNKIQEIKES
jgi:hypothetical protein